VGSENSEASVLGKPKSTPFCVAQTKLLLFIDITSGYFVHLVSSEPGTPEDPDRLIQQVCFIQSPFSHSNESDDSDLI